MIDFLRSLLFENVLLLMMAEAVAIAVVLAVRRRRLDGGTRRSVWITLAVCLLLLIVQHLVRTDRERIQAAVADMARAIDEGDVPSLGEHLDSEFQDRGLDKKAWLMDVRQRLQRWRIDEAKVSRFTTKVNGDEAEVSFAASCDCRSGEQNQSSVSSSWRLAFVRRDDGWKLHRVLAAKFGPGGMLDYKAILQY
jgi:hypothetical protein